MAIARLVPAECRLLAAAGSPPTERAKAHRVLAHTAQTSRTYAHPQSQSASSPARRAAHQLLLELPLDADESELEDPLPDPDPEVDEPELPLVLSEVPELELLEPEPEPELPEDELSLESEPEADESELLEEELLSVFESLDPDFEELLLESELELPEPPDEESVLELDLLLEESLEEVPESDCLDSLDFEEPDSPEVEGCPEVVAVVATMAGPAFSPMPWPAVNTWIRPATSTTAISEETTETMSTLRWMRALRWRRTCARCTAGSVTSLPPACA